MIWYFQLSKVWYFFFQDSFDCVSGQMGERQTLNPYFKVVTDLGLERFWKLPLYGRNLELKRR